MVILVMMKMIDFLGWLKRRNKFMILLQHVLCVGKVGNNYLMGVV